MQVGIVGLGLIGGSFAKAIKYKTANTVYGTDKDLSVVLKAKLLGALDAELTDEKLKECDIVLLALYPNDTIKYIEEKAELFKKDAVVIDTCGVKRHVFKPCTEAAAKNGFIFVGGHPMAGLHFNGFDYSEVNMFYNSAMIIIPPENEKSDAILMELEIFFKSIGFSKITISNPEEHDKIVAYTSELAHIVSNAYVKSPEAKVHSGFSAGSYKDLTRVAKLNEKMWAEIFNENKDFLLDELNGLIERLSEYKFALENDDIKKMTELLREGRLRKEQIDGFYRS